MNYRTVRNPCASIRLTGRVVRLRAVNRREAARVIERDGQPAMMVPLVFHRAGRPIVDFRKAWTTACINAGFAKPKLDADGRAVLDRHGRPVVVAAAILHDLRRCRRANLTRAGVDPTVAMKVSGHKTASMFRRYNIVDERDVRAVVTRTQAYLAEQPTERKIVTLQAVQGAGAHTLARFRRKSSRE